MCTLACIYYTRLIQFTRCYLVFTFGKINLWQLEPLPSRLTFQHQGSKRIGKDKIVRMLETVGSIDLKLCGKHDPNDETVRYGSQEDKVWLTPGSSPAFVFVPLASI